MKQNPVYNREMRVSSRSMKLPLIIFLFNGILFLVTLLNMYSVIMQVKASASIQYSSFMELYEFVTSMEFILLMFIVPAVTASAISGERGAADLRSDADYTDECRTDRNRKAFKCPQYLIFADPFQFSGSCHGICIWRNYLDRCVFSDPMLCNSSFFCRKYWHLFFSSF